MEAENKLTAGELADKLRVAAAKQTIDARIKKIAIRKLKLNIFFFILGASSGLFGLTYFGALDINCLAEKGYAPQSIVEPYNGLTLKVRAYLNG